MRGGRASFGKNFRVIGCGLLNSATSIMKRVSVRISEIVSFFIEASKDFKFNFSIKRQPIIVKTIAFIQKKMWFKKKFS
jgi:hypothetical protein